MKENDHSLNTATSELIQDVRKALLHDIQENGPGMEDPHIGFLLLQQSLDTIKGIMNMLDMETAYRTVLHSQGTTEGNAELIQIALILRSAQIQTRPLFQSIAEVSDIAYEELEQMVLNRQDEDEYIGRINEAVDFLARQTTDSTMRS